MAQENEHKFYVTKEGLDELLKEQDNLIHVVRQQSSCRKPVHRAT